MKKIIILALLTILLCPVFVLAQDELDTTPQLKAVAGQDKNVVVYHQVSFSALGSVINNIDQVEYHWDFGDGYWANGKEVTHTYDNSGVYRVKLELEAVVEGGQMTSMDEIIVNVDKDVMILISDVNLDSEKLQAVQTIASAQGTLVVNFQVQDEVDYIAEKELAQKILKSKDDIRQASSIVVWTENNVGLNALLEVAQDLTKVSGENGSNLDSFGFANKYFVVITDQNFSATARLGQSVYNLISPQFIVLTRAEAMNEVFSTTDFSGLLNRLKYGQTDYRLVGLHTQRDVNRLKWSNFVSYFVSYMVDNGVALNTIYLILVLPIIATVIAFFRQIIGVKAMGIYMPSIVAVSFLVTGLKYGLALFLMTLIVGTASRLFARKVRLSYLPRMAIVLTMVSFSIFLAFLLGAWMNKTGLLEISIFPILVMVLLTEKFISVQIERGHKSAIILVLETLFLSIICYWLVSWQFMRTFILGYPEFILGTIILNVLIGKWTGLRLTEYYRFRKVIKNVELATKK